MAKKQKRLSQAQKTINKMVAEKRATREQQVAAVGMSGQSRIFNIRNLTILKIVLVALMPLMYFIYSPMLIFLCLLYALTFFVSRRFEKKANKGLRKQLWIRVPRWDAVIAFVLLGIVIFGITLTGITTTVRPSEFEGMSRTQIRRTLEARGISNRDTLNRAANAIERSGATNSRGERLWIQFSTMFTGERVLFVPRDTLGIGGGLGRSLGSNGAVINPGGGDGSGGGRLVIRGEDGERHEFDLGTIGTGVTDVPFVNITVQIMVVLNSLVLAGLVAFGVYSIVKMRRLKKELVPAEHVSERLNA